MSAGIWTEAFPCSIENVVSRISGCRATKTVVILVKQRMKPYPSQSQLELGIIATLKITLYFVNRMTCKHGIIYLITWLEIMGGRAFVSSIPETLVPLAYHSHSGQDANVFSLSCGFWPFIEC